VRGSFGLRREVAGALLLLLLPVGLSWTVPAAESKPLTAIIVTARAHLRDSSFADSQVLVMNNLGASPVGVIVNRPTQIPVSRLFPDLKSLAKVRERVYFGGPVELESVWFLFRATKQKEHAIEALKGVYISANPALLRQLLGRDKPMEGLRIFVGHAGWGPGQLEAEISRGDWTVHRAEADAIFNGKSDHPWPSPAPPGPTT